MSEQNILNPTTTSALNPDYSVKVTDPQTMSEWQPRSGKWFGRRLSARGVVFDLTWQARLLSDYLALDQWFHQYESDFFTFSDYDTGRYYSGKFAAQPTKERAGYNKVNVSAQFVEIPGLPMYQYPNNWSRDAVFLEERGSWPVPSGNAPTINDLVKLTGSNWDRHDKNYCPFSEDLTQWTVTAGVTVSLVSDTSPVDGVSAINASQVAYNGSGASGSYRIYQSSSLPGYPTAAPLYAPAGYPYTASIWLRVTSGTVTVRINGNGSSYTTCVLTTNWQRFAVTDTSIAAGNIQLIIFSNTSDNAAWTIRAFGAQIEFGSSASTYAKTTAATAYLTAPNLNGNLHGGFAYFDSGTVNTDAAEWVYLGYGLQVWAPKGPDMGIMQVYLDTVLQGTIDLYAAALTASAAVFTITNVPLGFHRVKLSPTNTKNASSSGFAVAADALQVMR
jgi:hypothetical protein